MIKFFDFTRKYAQYRKPIDAAILRVLKRGWFILGPEVEEFEKRFASYLGVKHAIGLNSGTDAIALALMAHGVGAGDEVITVANTAVPTVSAIRMTGAKPVFVDVRPDTHTMDAELLEKAIGSHTKAIVPVHLYGYPADMRAILAIARRHKLVVIEDACQAHGARSRGKMVGTLGHAGCFSFYPTKNLGGFGDGGAVVTNSDATAARLRAIRNYGEVSKFKSSFEGINSRLDEMQAALLTFGLGHLDAWTAEREKLAQMYLSALRGIPGLELPEDSDQVQQRVWHLFVVRTGKRDQLRDFLKARGIDTMTHYPQGIHTQKAYRFLGYKPGDLPNTVRLASRILSLPLYPGLKVSEVKQVCSAIQEFYGA